MCTKEAQNNYEQTKSLCEKLLNVYTKGTWVIFLSSFTPRVATKGGKMVV